MIQNIIVFIILVCAIGYVALRIFNTFKTSGNKCQGCEGCSIKEEMMRNHCEKNRKKQVIDACCAKNKQKNLVG